MRALIADWRFIACCVTCLKDKAGVKLPWTHAGGPSYDAVYGPQGWCNTLDGPKFE